MKSWASIVLKIGVGWEISGRTASRAQCIGEPVTDYVDANQMFLVCCLVCSPGMMAPNQLLRFGARQVLDSGSSLVTQSAASHYLSPEIGGSRVIEEERFGNFNWSLGERFTFSRQFVQMLAGICSPGWKLLNRVRINALLSYSVRMKPF